MFGCCDTQRDMMDEIDACVCPGGAFNQLPSEIVELMFLSIIISMIFKLIYLKPSEFVSSHLHLKAAHQIIVMTCPARYI